ncbi:MAG: hypothetical protein CMJ83_20670 [Planctomycetes bacterium]|nr:hypothetical protein [Planctomycetota bacterium]
MKKLIVVVAAALTLMLASILPAQTPITGIGHKVCAITGAEIVGACPNPCVEIAIGEICDINRIENIASYEVAIDTIHRIDSGTWITCSPAVQSIN